jgi:hypothetical protein
VWFEMRENAAGGRAEAAGGSELMVDWSDLDDWPALEETAGGSLALIRIVAMPLDVLRAATEQYDALFREFRLILERDPYGGTSVPGRLIALIDELGSRFASFTAEQDHALQEALARRDATIDLEYRLPPEVGAASVHYDELLDEADEYCRSGTHLLTLAPPAPAVAFRKWFLQEFARQAQGAEPLAWHDSEWGSVRSRAVG